MTLFEEKVYKIVRLIPRGRVGTYKGIAKAIGAPDAARAVGNALNKNLYPVGRRRRSFGAFASKVPCHRVVHADGKIGGFASGTRNKIKILKKERIVIKNGQINLKKFGWKFQEESS